MSVRLNPPGGWQAEAQALIQDIKQHVHSIKVSSEHESSDMRIFFDIVTLERDKFIVSMDSVGFQIEALFRGQGDESQPPEENIDDNIDDNKQETSSRKIYETINALLDENSPKYRGSFARALMDKMKSI